MDKLGMIVKLRTDVTIQNYYPSLLIFNKGERDYNHVMQCKRCVPE